MTTKDIKNLTDDIRHQQCVLVLGPEIVQWGNERVHRALEAHLLSNNEDDIAYHYERDSFFLFKDKLAEEDVLREVKRFYEPMSAQVLAGSSSPPSIATTLYSQIAQIPFHLVISINPDDFLSLVYLQQGIPHYFDHFKSTGESVHHLETPTKEMPLIYNLFGYYQNEPSLILEYDDLFQFMRAAFGSPGLPLKLKSSLKTTKTFICLGFDFDKWYSPLLLRLLSSEKDLSKQSWSIKKYSAYNKIDASESKSVTFLNKQFGVRFVGDEHHFLDALYDSCAAQNLLRPVITAHSTEQAQIYQHIRTGNLENAIQLLSTYAAADSDLSAKILLLESQFNSLKTSKHDGLITDDNYRVAQNRIRNSILFYVQEITPQS